MNNDIEKLNAAVDAFAGAMKERFQQKVKEGYTGWDGDYPTQNILEEIKRDAEFLHEDHCWETRFKPGKLSVDIANRCMMLWYREKNRV